MVINRTSAEAVSIHAVSPLFGVGASAARANDGSSASPARPARIASAAIRRKPPTLIFLLPPSVCGDFFSGASGARGSDRAIIGLARADANRMVDRRNEDLAVPDLARLGRADDGFYSPVHGARRDHDLDLHLG